MSEEKFELKFEWDEYKSILNEQQHGFPLEESIEAFYDPYALIRSNAYQVQGEDRYILIGKTEPHGLIFVVHAEIGAHLIRLISARNAEPDEIDKYNENIVKYFKP